MCETFEMVDPTVEVLRKFYCKCPAHAGMPVTNIVDLSQPTQDGIVVMSL
jgi:hypothetical protein